MRPDRADEVNAQIERAVDELIATGHPAAVEAGYNRSAVWQWYTSKHPRGIELKVEYREAMRRRLGWRAPEKPISPPDQEVDPTSGHLRAKRLGEALKFSGQTHADAKLRYMARERCIENGEDPRDPRAFNERYVEVCVEDREHALREGRESLADLHRRELRQGR